ISMEGSAGRAAVPPSSPTQSTSATSLEELERIACTDAEGVTRKELIAHQIAVDRNLCKGVHVQLAGDLEVRACGSGECRALCRRTKLLRRPDAERDERNQHDSLREGERQLGLRGRPSVKECHLLKGLDDDDEHVHE